MCGILSLMPAMMGVPMEAILGTVGVGPDVTNALASGAGRLGAVMGLAVALEGKDGVACHDFMAKLPRLDADAVNACHTQALVWASSIGQEA